MDYNILYEAESVLIEVNSKLYSPDAVCKSYQEEVITRNIDKDKVEILKQAMKIFNVDWNCDFERLRQDIKEELDKHNFKIME